MTPITDLKPRDKRKPNYREHLYQLGENLVAALALAAFTILLLLAAIEWGIPA